MVEHIGAKVDRNFDEKKNVLATKSDLANTNAEIIKWMFIFWIGQLALLIAILQIFFKR